MGVEQVEVVIVHTRMDKMEEMEEVEPQGMVMLEVLAHKDITGEMVTIKMLVVVL